MDHQFFCPLLSCKSKRANLFIAHSSVNFHARLKILTLSPTFYAKVVKTSYRRQLQ